VIEKCKNCIYRIYYCVRDWLDKWQDDYFDDLAADEDDENGYFEN